MGRNTHTFIRNPEMSSAFSYLFLKPSHTKDTSARFRQKDSESRLDRSTSFYLLISPQTKGVLFLSIQVYTYLTHQRIGRITLVAQIQK